ncbi:MAG: tetratricopeptide repeat protein [Candidatus Doudnabacteria bacterium]
MTYEIIPQFVIVLALAGIIVILGRKLPEVRELKIDAVSESRKNRKTILAVLKAGLPRIGYFILSIARKGGRAGEKILVLCGRGLKALGGGIKGLIEARRENRQKMPRQNEKIQREETLMRADDEQEARGLRRPKPFMSQGFKAREVKVEIPSAPLEREERKELSLEELLTDAQNAVKIKHFKAAEKICFSVIRKSPKNAQVYKILGTLYFEQGNFRDAESSFREALKRRADEVDIYRKLGLAYTGEGKMKEAEKIYRRAIKNNRAKEYFYLELGKMYRNQNNIDKTVRTYEELVKAYPGNYQYLELLEKQRKIKGNQ